VRAFLPRSSDPAVVISLHLRKGSRLLDTGLAMRRIIQANIDRFKELLKTEADPMKRVMETRLLAEEEAKLAKLPKPEKKKA
jgi:hypothetical protein